MKLTKSQLKRIIQEELQKVLMREGTYPDAVPLYQRIDGTGRNIPDGMEINFDNMYQWIEDPTTIRNPQIQAVKRMQDQISSCAPMGVPYGGDRLKPSGHSWRDRSGEWHKGISDPEFQDKNEAKSLTMQSFEVILAAVKIEDFEFAIETAMGVQESLPTECQQLGANLLQLLGSFVAKGGGLSGESGERFKAKETEAKLDPRALPQAEREGHDVYRTKEGRKFVRPKSSPPTGYPAGKEPTKVSR